jgi:hypothetical protein
MSSRLNITGIGDGRRRTITYKNSSRAESVDGDGGGRLLM